MSFVKVTSVVGVSAGPAALSAGAAATASAAVPIRIDPNVQWRSERPDAIAMLLCRHCRT
jgi:hypothetical protein